MSENPYSPPNAEVGDVHPGGPAAPRPREVVVAVRLLWLSLVAGIPVSIREYQDGASEGNAAFLLYFTLSLYAISVFMVLSLQRGHNWARIVLLVFNVLNLLSFLFAFSELRKYPTGDFVILVLVVGLDLAALYLVYTRAAAEWFRRPKAVR
jgi:hypothetical protein